MSKLKHIISYLILILTPWIILIPVTLIATIIESLINQGSTPTIAASIIIFPVIALFFQLFIVPTYTVFNSIYLVLKNKLKLVLSVILVINSLLFIISVSSFIWLLSIAPNQNSATNFEVIGNLSVAGFWYIFIGQTIHFALLLFIRGKQFEPGKLKDRTLNQAV